jgi:hypothetical protein
MLLSRFQFTIGQLVQVILVSGLVFWTMRTSIGAALLSTFPLIDGVICARTAKVMSIWRSTLCRIFVLGLFATGYCTYFYFFPLRHAFLSVEYIFAIFFLSVVAPVVNRLWHAVINRGYQLPPSDEACGTIAWRGFRDLPSATIVASSLPESSKSSSASAG